ncbi:hypothetical protein BH23ACT11_BH23ACT11_22750 [soil metagenome]
MKVLLMVFEIDHHKLLWDPVEDVFALGSAVVAEAFFAA